MYACSEHTIEPSQLAAVCTALNVVGKRGMHFIWADFEEFMYVGVFRWLRPLEAEHIYFSRSKDAKADILDATEHRVTTQRTVKGSGHLVSSLWLL